MKTLEEDRSTDAHRGDEDRIMLFADFGLLPCGILTGRDPEGLRGTPHDLVHDAKDHGYPQALACEI